MKQHTRKDGTPLTKDEIAEVEENLAKRKPEGLKDEDICKEAGISLATLADIAYGR